MRFLLDFLYLLATPIVILCVLVPSRFFTRKRYRAGLRAKIVGTDLPPSARPSLWVHAVSVGEVRTALPLVEALAAAFPDLDLVLSTSTDTGHEVAEKGLAALGLSVRLTYFPFDFSWSVRRSLRRLKPRAVVLIELELWPNFLLAARARGVPVFVANGRITERSSRRYRRTAAAGRLLFSLPSAYAAQNDVYAERFRSLGVDSERIAVLGNLKYDASPSALASGSETGDRLGWTSDSDLVLMGGCTHAGEEAILLETYEAARESMGALRLVLAPRHIERSREVMEIARRSRAGEPALWSQIAGGAAPAAKFRVLVVDVIGELDRFYAMADIVFVGGTLVPHGGHNILEPCRLARATLHGPSMHNFEELDSHFQDREAAIRVDGADALRGAVQRLLEDRAEREALGRRALAASRELQGAVRRHVEWLSGLLTAR